MPADSRLTEKPGVYDDKFRLIKAQMMKSSKIKKNYSEEEVEVMIKHSLIEEAYDKIEFSLRGQLRRGAPEKKGMSEDEFSKEWKTAMKKRLKADGYPFKLEPKEQGVFKAIKARKENEAIEEVTKTAAEAMKKILTSIN